MLETLSLAYNTMRDLDSTLIHIFSCYPVLKHLNLIKNPINPMFAGQAAKYDEFRAKFKIWIPSLITLDGIDFTKDAGKIAEIKTQVDKSKQLATGGGLPSIPEEGKSGQTPADSGAAKGGASGGQRSYQFN